MLVCNRTLGDYLIAFSLSEFPGALPCRYLVIRSGMLDVGAVSAVDYRDIGCLEFLDDFIAGRFSRILDNELYAFFQCNADRVDAFRKRNVLVTVFEIWPEFSFCGGYADTFIFADNSRKFEKCQCLFKRYAFYELSFPKARTYL